MSETTHTNGSPSVNGYMKVQEIRELLLGAATALDSQWSPNWTGPASGGDAIEVNENG